MTEHVGLIAKMYSLTIRPSKKRTAKGVSKSVIRSKLRHSSYKQCLSELEQQIETMVTFRSEKHQLHTIAFNKTTLSPYDYKRYILKDGVHTVTQRHWRISHDASDLAI